MINDVKMASNNILSAVIDGERWDIPDDMGNRDRYRIWDEWEMGPPDPDTGERERVNTIPPYVAPPAPLGVLSARQFWIAALEIGITKDGLLSDIASKYEGDEREFLSVEVRESSTFVRENPLIEELSAMYDIEPYQLDELWLRAASI